MTEWRRGQAPAATGAVARVTASGRVRAARTAAVQRRLRCCLATICLASDSCEVHVRSQRSQWLLARGERRASRDGSSDIGTVAADALLAEGPGDSADIACMCGVEHRARSRRRSFFSITVSAEVCQDMILTGAIDVPVWLSNRCVLHLCGLLCGVSGCSADRFVDRYANETHGGTDPR